MGGDGGTCQLHVACTAGTHDDHLPQGGGNARGHQDLLCHVAQTQHILRRGDEGTLGDVDAGLLRACHHIGGLSVTADGGKPQYPVVGVGQHPVEHGGLAGVFAHAHDGQCFHAMQLSQQFLFHLFSPSKGKTDIFRNSILQRGKKRKPKRGLWAIISSHFAHTDER